MTATESIDSLLAERDAVGVDRFTAPDYRAGRVLHIVLFAFVDGVTDAQRADVIKRFLALAETERSGHPYIRSIEAGVQLSGEAATNGFELGFVVTFDSLGDRNFYVGEPIVTDPSFFDGTHAEFKRFVGPLLRSVQVFDFQP